MKSTPQLIIMWSGAALLVVGIMMIIPQFYIEISQMQRAIQPEGSVAGIQPSGGLAISTHYVGVTVLAFGTFLEMVGYLATRPWR